MNRHHLNIQNKEKLLMPNISYEAKKWEIPKSKFISLIYK